MAANWSWAFQTPLHSMTDNNLLFTKTPCYGPLDWESCDKRPTKPCMRLGNAAQANGSNPASQDNGFAPSATA